MQGLEIGFLSNE